MDLDLKKLRYDLALIYAKSHFETCLKDGSFTSDLEGPIDMEFIDETNALIQLFGRMYRELSLTTDYALLLQMRLIDENSQLASEED